MKLSQRSGATIEVAGICGSLRDGSYTRMTINTALAGAREVGALTRLIDLRDYDLIFCDGKKDESIYPKGVFDLRRDVKRAQGVILGTPEYHGGVSGVLKNALDLMGFDEFESKIIGLVGVSGGAMGAVSALNSLRTVGRVLHAWVIPEQVSVSQAWKAFDSEGNLKDRELEGRVLELGRQVARFAFLHTSEKALEFVRQWEGAPVNPGGGRVSDVDAEPS
ncbi:MAG: NADPH-dependent FMN reductase [Fidelibacterota bacterium]